MNGYYQKANRWQVLAQMGRKAAPCELLLGVQIGATTMENRTEVPQNSKDRTTIWSSSSTSGYLSEENKNTNLNRYTHPTFTAALFTVATNWKQPGVHRQMNGSLKWIMGLKYYSATKMEILSFVTIWMELEGIILSEISQRQISHDFPCMGSKKQE